MRKCLQSKGVKPFPNALGSLKGIRPLLIIRGDILHNILLGILKHLMEWTEGFLRKHKRMEVFDTICSNIPPYPGYQRLQKRYRQITMWSGLEMRGVNHVILACCAAALRRTTDAPRLSATAQRDAKTAIRCVRAIIDFCLMAQYCTHTQETIKYMDKYLVQLHQHMHIFG